MIRRAFSIKTMMQLIACGFLAFMSSQLLAIYCGVLPWTYDQQGRGIVLLGKDGHRSGFDVFGGSPDRNETCKRAASREFLEETVKLYGDPEHANKIQGIEQKLNLYFLLPANTLRTRGGDFFPEHYIYPLQVHWISSDNFRSAVAQRGLHDKYKEKNDFAWVYAKELADALSQATYNVAGGVGQYPDIFVQSRRNKQIRLDNGIVQTLIRDGAGIQFLRSIINN